MKITNNIGVFNYDKITTNGIDNVAAPISLKAKDVTSPVAANGVMAHPDTISIFDPTPTIPTSCDDVVSPKVANDTYSFTPMILPTCDSDSGTFLRDVEDSDDALLFAGMLNDNEDGIDGSSIVAVDELLSLDQILGFDSSDLDLDDDWL